MNVATIYVLCDSRIDDPVARVRYVGQTRIDIAQRLRRHWVTALAGAHEHRAVWMRAVRAAGGHVLIVAVDSVPSSEADTAESAHVARFRALGCDLTNRTDGGRGRRGWDVSAETRRKMSESASRRPPKSLEARQRLSEAIKSSPSHIVHRERLHRMNCRPCPPETRQRISEALRGEGNGQNVLTWESVAVIRERYAAGVRQAQLVRDFKVSAGTIHRVVHCNGWMPA